MASGAEPCTAPRRASILAGRLALSERLPQPVSRDEKHSAPSRQRDPTRHHERSRSGQENIKPGGGRLCCNPARRPYGMLMNAAPESNWLPAFSKAPLAVGLALALGAALPWSPASARSIGAGAPPAVRDALRFSD